MMDLESSLSIFNSMDEILIRTTYEKIIKTIMMYNKFMDDHPAG